MGYSMSAATGADGFVGFTWNPSVTRGKDMTMDVVMAYQLFQIRTCITLAESEGAGEYDKSAQRQLVEILPHEASMNTTVKPRCSCPISEELLSRVAF